VPLGDVELVRPDPPGRPLPVVEVVAEPGVVVTKPACSGPLGGAALLSSAPPLELRRVPAAA
jgi:hypothetical protein